MLSGLSCTAKKTIVTLQECIACAESIDCVCDYTPSLIRSMISERIDEYIHVTDLTTCPRQKILKRQIPYIEKLDNLFFKFRGTGLHLAIELKSSKNLLTEFEVSINIDGETIIGRIDEIDLKNAILRDYKTAAEYPRHPYVAHTKQINIYKYMYELEYNTEIKFLELIYISMRGVKKFRVSPENRDDVEKFLKERVNHIKNAKNLINTVAEFGPLCGYCPEEVKRYCRAIEIKKWLKEKGLKKLPSIEEIIAEMPVDLYAMD